MDTEVSENNESEEVEHLNLWRVATVVLFVVSIVLGGVIVNKTNSLTDSRDEARASYNKELATKYKLCKYVKKALLHSEAYSDVDKLDILSNYSCVMEP